MNPILGPARRNLRIYRRKPTCAFSRFVLPLFLIVSAVSLRYPPILARPVRRPVEWIKKWFLRKRKADGKNKILTPTIPTLVENEPPVQDGQTLGHAHSKFWGLDAFSAADSNCFSPSVGYIPKFYGHRRYSPLTGTLVGRTTDSRGNEEGRMCRNAETVTPATYDLRESLLGVDAFTGYLSSSATEGTSGFHSESLDITLAVDDLSFALLPEASCTERSIYPDNSLDSEVFSGPENATTLDFTLTGYTTSSMSSLDTVDDFILAPKDLEFPPATSCDMTKDFELDSFESTTGHLDSDSSSFPGFSDLSNYITGTLDESSAFYEDLFLQVTNTNQDPTEDSINLIDYRGLPCVDFCLGDGADNSSFE